jgi:hypothetical protein
MRNRPSAICPNGYQGAAAPLCPGMETVLDDRLAAALLLGWRVSELYALADDTGAPASDTLLPAHGSLEPADQLELELRAAAGVARRAGVTSKGASLEELVRQARGAAGSPAAAEAFRARLRHCHVEVQKDLWALDESAGKAYELGNGLSDTYGRVRRAYRHAADDALATWEDVFHPDRIERLKKLLDDLQTRLNAAGVAVVRAQLDAWRDGVAARLRADGLPPEARVREGLRRQTVIWRQLLTGDKAPEAYLDRHARAALHDDLRALVWRRYRVWALVLAAAAVGVALAWKDLEGAGRAVLAAATALGVTKASVLLSVRGRLDQWSGLLWDRALAQRIVEVTLTLDAVLPPPPRRRLYERRMSTLKSGSGGPTRRATSAPGSSLEHQRAHATGSPA